MKMKICIALTALAVGVVLLPAPSAAQVDSSATAEFVKSIWHTLTPAERESYMELLLRRNAGSGSLPTGAGADGADNCGDAVEISGCPITVPYDNSNATEDGLDDPLCDFFGTQAIDNDVWFCWTAQFDNDTVTVEDCGMSSVDTKFAAYGPYTDCAAAKAACPPTDIVACDDDTVCGLQSSVTFATPVAGEAYLLRIGTFPGATGGSGNISVTCTVPVELETFSVE